MKRRGMLAGIVALSAGCISRNEYRSGTTVEFEGGWRHDYHDDEGEAICYSNGTVFSGSKDGTIVAVRDVDGKFLWRKDVHERLPKNLITSEFTRDIYAMKNAIYSAGRNGEVVALDPTDGSELWRHGHHDDAVWEVHEGNGIVYSSGRDGKVVAADASNGTLCWSHTAHHVDGNPSNEMIRTVYYSDDKVYTAGFDGRIITVSAEDGEILWKYDFGHTIKSVHQSDGTVFFSPFTPELDEDVIGIDEDSLELTKSHSHHDQDAEGFRRDHTGVEELYVSNGIIYSAGDDGMLVAANVSDLSLICKHKKHTASVRSVVSDNGYAYTTGRDGIVIKYHCSNNE